MTQTKLPIHTEYYALIVGEDGNKLPIYQVVNLETGVVEYDDPILPRSIEALNNLTEKLAEAYKELRKGEVPLSLTAIKGGKDEGGEGSLH